MTEPVEGQIPMFELRGEPGPEIVNLPGPGTIIPARESDPETSHAATREIRVKAGSQRAYLLRAFAKYPEDGLTDEQAAINDGHVSMYSEYAKRCSELRDGGFIEPTGETRPGMSGQARIVSRITDKGRDWLRENH